MDGCFNDGTGVQLVCFEEVLLGFFVPTHFNIQVAEVEPAFIIIGF